MVKGSCELSWVELRYPAQGTDKVDRYYILLVVIACSVMNIHLTGVPLDALPLGARVNTHTHTHTHRVYTSTHYTQ